MKIDLFKLDFYSRTAYFFKIAISWKTLSVCVLIFLTQDAISQPVLSGYIDKPNFTAITPEVASLARQSMTSLNLYNGIPDVSIPICSIKEGDSDFSILLKYSSGSGIKVDEEATWVGLGWDLVAGGSISRCIVGGLDRPNVYDTPKADWEAFYKSNPAFGQPSVFILHDKGDCLWSPSLQCSTSDATPATILTQIENGIAGEQDYYVASFNGHIVKFFIDPTTSKILIVGRKSNEKIEFLNGSWKITDNEGYTYFFDEQELTDLPNSIGFNGGGSIPTRWYLTKIVTPTFRQISFKYQTFGQLIPMPKLSSYEVYNDPNFTNPNATAINARDVQCELSFSTDNQVHIKYLKEINTSNSTLKFLSGARDDVAGDGGRRLDSIIVINRWSGEVQKKFAFSYGYFLTNHTGGDYLSYFYKLYASNPAVNMGVLPYFNDNNKYKRLKLISLTEISASNRVLSPYEFLYQETLGLPAKSSASCDYWGYFNNKEQYDQKPGLKAIIPDLVNYLKVNPDDAADMPANIDQFYQGANRMADTTSIKEGILRCVKYPAGGRTEYYYESNTFNNYKILSNNNSTISNYFIVNDKNDPSWTPGSTYAFTLDKGYYVKLTSEINGGVENKKYFNQMIGSSIKLERNNGGSYTTVLSRSMNSTSEEEKAFNATFKKEWIDRFFLPAGSYRLTADLNNNLGIQYSLNAVVKANLEVENDNLKESFGGGIRVAKIIDYDGEAIKSRKSFFYTDNNSQTSGLLMSQPNFFLKRSSLVRTGGLCPTPPVPVPWYSWYYYSAPVNPLQLSAQGAYVGYSCVKEVYADISGTKDNGYNVYYFQNNPDKGSAQTPTCPPFIDPYNGSVIRKLVFTTDNKLVSSTHNQYTLYSTDYYTYNAKVERSYVGPTNTSSVTCPAWSSLLHNPLRQDVPYIFNIYVYPYQCVWQDLYKKCDTLYNKSDPSSYISSEIQYDYNRSNLLRKFQLFHNSAKDSILTEYRYVADFPGIPVMLEMSNRHILSPIIQSTVKKNRTLVNKVSYEYSQYEGGIIQPARLAITNYSNKPDSVSFYYHNYDSNGNILSCSKKGRTTSCFIWSYNGCFPVAEINNADYSTIVNILGGSNAISAFRNRNPTDTEVNSFLAPLRQNILLKEASISTYTFSPFIGMTSETDAKGKTTYYKYDDFLRLWQIQNQDGKVVKMYDYHYKY